MTSAINLDTLADGVDAEERVGFLKEIREAIAALREAEAALG